MPVIRRDELSSSITGHYDKLYKAKLKKALHDPLLTAEEREHIKELLSAVGKPKIYRADSPPKKGAIDLT